MRSLPYIAVPGLFQDIMEVLEEVVYAVMEELVRQKYSRLIYPEHPRAIDYDRQGPDFSPYYPGGGGYAAFAYNVGYTKAVLQAALTS